MRNNTKVRVSPETLQGNLLEIAKQQREIQRLNSLLAAERQRSNELTNRWAQVRTECGAPSDDSVVEVLERVRAGNAEELRLSALSPTQAGGQSSPGPGTENAGN